MDELLTFVTYRPAWVGRDGYPLSWQHFQYGLRHIARERLREQLTHAQAIRLSRIPEDDWNIWQRDVARMTEVPPHG